MQACIATPSSRASYPLLPQTPTLAWALSVMMAASSSQIIPDPYPPAPPSPPLSISPTEDHISLGAELDDGSLIIGQHQISHPTAEGGSDSPRAVDKSCDETLPAPIKRIFYMSAGGVLHMPDIDACIVGGDCCWFCSA